MSTRTIVAELWVPRAIESKASGLVIRERRDVEVTVDVERWQQTVNGVAVPGARFTLRFVELDPRRGDAELARQALEYALLAVNRIVRAVAYQTNHARAVPALRADELVGFEVVEDLGIAGRRPLAAPDTSPLRAILFKGAIDPIAVQQLLDRAFSSTSVAEELWREALDAVYEQRSREALVAARAAVEVAWEDVARARVDTLSASESLAVQAVLRAHLDEALLSRTPMKVRLDRYSRSLLGFSVHDAWGDARWSEVGAFFEARNRGAHGGGSVSHEDALRGVRVARELIDKIEEARPAIAGGSS